MMAEVNKLTIDTNIIKKKNGELVLTIGKEGKAHRVFVDNTDGGPEDIKMKEHYYFGQFKDINCYVVGIGYWEHFEVLLIDRETGLNQTFWSTPSLSPNNKNLAAILSAGLEGNPVGIQVFSYDSSTYYKFDKILEINQMVWDPVEFYWYGNEALVLKVMRITNESININTLADTSFGYIRIRIDC